MTSCTIYVNKSSHIYTLLLTTVRDCIISNFQVKNHVQYNNRVHKQFKIFRIFILTFILTLTKRSLKDLSQKYQVFFVIHNKSGIFFYSKSSAFKNPILWRTPCKSVKSDLWIQEYRKVEKRERLEEKWRSMEAPARVQLSTLSISINNKYKCVLFYNSFLWGIIFIECVLLYITVMKSRREIECRLLEIKCSIQS